MTEPFDPDNVEKFAQLLATAAAKMGPKLLQGAKAAMGAKEGAGAAKTLQQGVGILQQNKQMAQQKKQAQEQRAIDMARRNSSIATGEPMDIAMRLLKYQTTLPGYDPEIVSENIEPQHHNIWISPRPGNEELPHAEVSQRSDDMLDELSTLHDQHGPFTITSATGQGEWGVEPSFMLTDVPTEAREAINRIAEAYGQQSIGVSEEGEEGAKFVTPQGEVTDSFGGMEMQDEPEYSTDYPSGQKLAFTDWIQTGEPMEIAWKLLKYEQRYTNWDNYSSADEQHPVEMTESSNIMGEDAPEKCTLCGEGIPAIKARFNNPLYTQDFTHHICPECAEQWDLEYLLPQSEGEDDVKVAGEPMDIAMRLLKGFPYEFIEDEDEPDSDDPSRKKWRLDPDEQIWGDEADEHLREITRQQQDYLWNLPPEQKLWFIRAHGDPLLGPQLENAMLEASDENMPEMAEPRNPFSTQEDFDAYKDMDPDILNNFLIEAMLDSYGQGMTSMGGLFDREPVERRNKHFVDMEGNSLGYKPYMSTDVLDDEPSGSPIGRSHAIDPHQWRKWASEPMDIAMRLLKDESYRLMNSNELARLTRAGDEAAYDEMLDRMGDWVGADLPPSPEAEEWIEEQGGPFQMVADTMESGKSPKTPEGLAQAVDEHFMEQPYYPPEAMADMYASETGQSPYRKRYTNQPRIQLPIMTPIHQDETGLYDWQYKNASEPMEIAMQLLKESAEGDWGFMNWPKNEPHEEYSSEALGNPSPPAGVTHLHPKGESEAWTMLPNILPWFRSPQGRLDHRPDEQLQTAVASNLAHENTHEGLHSIDEIYGNAAQDEYPADISGHLVEMRNKHQQWKNNELPNYGHRKLIEQFAGGMEPEQIAMNEASAQARWQAQMGDKQDISGFNINRFDSEGNLVKRGEPMDLAWRLLKAPYDVYTHEGNQKKPFEGTLYAGGDVTDTPKYYTPSLEGALDYAVYGSATGDVPMRSTTPAIRTVQDPGFNEKGQPAGSLIADPQLQDAYMQDDDSPLQSELMDDDTLRQLILQMSDKSPKSDTTGYHHSQQDREKHIQGALERLKNKTSGRLDLTDSEKGIGGISTGRHDELDMMDFDDINSGWDFLEDWEKSWLLDNRFDELPMWLQEEHQDEVKTGEPMDLAWRLLKRQTTLGEFHPDFPSPHGPTKWFHGTNNLALPKIEREGIKASGDYDPYTSGVHVTSDLDRATHYAKDGPFSVDVRMDEDRFDPSTHKPHVYGVREGFGEPIPHPDKRMEEDRGYGYYDAPKIPREFITPMPLDIPDDWQWGDKSEPMDIAMRLLKEEVDVSGQHAPRNDPRFWEVMRHYGTQDPNAVDVPFYPYSKELGEMTPQVDELIAGYEYKPYYFGGRYPMPDLDKKNYDTGHLAIFDPGEEATSFGGNEQFTANWRKLHELGHAQGLEDLNAEWGEGRRLGKVGARTPREMLRAVDWETRALENQRKLMEEIGLPVRQIEYNRDWNTTLGDAGFRAVTGQFTSPEGEGFVPYDERISPSYAMNAVTRRAEELGLDMDETLRDKRGSARKVAGEPMDLAWRLLKRQTTLGEFHPDFPSPHGPVTAWRSAPAADPRGPIEPRNLRGYFKDIHPDAPEALTWGWAGQDARAAAEGLSREWSQARRAGEWGGRPRRVVGIRGPVSQDYKDMEWSGNSMAGLAYTGKDETPDLEAFGTTETIPEERQVRMPTVYYEGEERADLMKSKPMSISDVLVKERISPEAKRHKLEYDKEYESSPERIKYREELNRERSQRGMYGDHSHRDISHTEGGKLTVEDEHKNRARHFKDKGTLRPLVKSMRDDLELLRNLMAGPMDEQDKKIADAIVSTLAEREDEPVTDEEELKHQFFRGTGNQSV